MSKAVKPSWEPDCAAISDRYHTFSEKTGGPSILQASFEPLSLDLLVLPETSLLLVASVIEPLRAANRISGRPLYDWRLFSPDGEAIETHSGIPVPAAGRFKPGRETRPLFVLSSYQWQRSVNAHLRRQLFEAGRHRSMLAGIESGSWLLAAAGLLDGNRVTVHWEDRTEFMATYPQIRVGTERFVIDGKRMTSCGSLPTLDLMLEIIRRRQGYSLSREVSRLFIYERELMDRSQPVVPAGAMRVNDERVAQALRIMEETIEAPLTLVQLAKRVGITARHLQVLFKGALNAPPHEHYASLRLNAARRRIIETHDKISEISVIAGFGSASAFSRSYRSTYGESPRETRQRVRRPHTGTT